MRARTCARDSARSTCYGKRIRKHRAREIPRRGERFLSLRSAFSASLFPLEATQGSTRDAISRKFDREYPSRESPKLLASRTKRKSLKIFIEISHQDTHTHTHTWMEFICIVLLFVENRFREIRFLQEVTQSFLGSPPKEFDARRLRAISHR